MSSSNSAVERRRAPLWLPRLITLLLAWSWSIVGVGVGINALSKSKKTQSDLRKQVPTGVTLNINVNDVYHSGIVATVVCGLIFLVTTASVASLFSRPIRRLRLQSLLLAFLSTWLFATLVPFTHFVRTRRAKISAFLGGLAIPDQTVQSVEAQMGTTSVYRHINYLKLVAILMWFTLLFSIIASVVLFMAGSRRSTANNVLHSDRATAETHKEESLTEKSTA
ncbi:hypothetical protein BDQ12DRAFT_692554 [Crucibulum laeve]|uniref:MARVEL domain-containing protein n=1 Tax=Crucibulum laeve TaxID=68775 RepID=A0A5C3LHR9_9AGAR|nr:hypothetical protein BDQ12DRAFT_692554 [Crucibulum laeve]